MSMHVSAWPPYHCRVTPCTRIRLPRVAPLLVLQRRHSAARSAMDVTTLPSATWPACHGWPCSAFVSLHVRQRVEGSASARATTSGASLRYRPLCQAARATRHTPRQLVGIVPRVVTTCNSSVATSRGGSHEVGQHRVTVGDTPPAFTHIARFTQRTSSGGHHAGRIGPAVLRVAAVRRVLDEVAFPA